MKSSRNQVSKNATAEVIIRPGPLHSVVLDPTVATVEITGRQQFTAMPLDQFGNEIPQLAFNWLTEAAGEVDSTGRFTAGTKAGTYEEGVIVEVTVGANTKRARAEVTITPGPLSRVVVEPSVVTLDIGGAQQFRFTALDEFGNEVSGATVWSVTPDIGTIDSSGLLNAGSRAGEFPSGLQLRVVEGTTRIMANADLSIRPDPLFSVDIEPAAAVVRPGATQRFTATGLDFFGNPIPGLEFAWDATGGVIEEINLGTADFHGGAPGSRYEVKASALFRNSARTGMALVGIPPGWMPAGNMAEPRRDHAAVLLDDGTVLIVGGTRATAELYDPATLRFTLLGSVPFRQGVRATRLADGGVLVVGEGGTTPGRTVMIYDPATKQFRPTGSLNAARGYSSVTLLPDGKVLVAGGQEGAALPGCTPCPQTLAVVEVYDPATGDFTVTASLNEHRSAHAAVLLPSGKVLIVGGTQTSTPGSGFFWTSLSCMTPPWETLV